MPRKPLKKLMWRLYHVKAQLAWNLLIHQSYTVSSLVTFKRPHFICTTSMFFVSQHVFDPVATWTSEHLADFITTLNVSIMLLYIFSHLINISVQQTFSRYQFFCFQSGYKYLEKHKSTVSVPGKITSQWGRYTLWILVIMKYLWWQ